MRSWCIFGNEILLLETLEDIQSLKLHFIIWAGEQALEAIQGKTLSPQSRQRHKGQLPPCSSTEFGRVTLMINLSSLPSEKGNRK